MAITAAERCALLVVDMQNDFCDPEGSVAATFGLDTSASRSMLPRLINMIAVARATGVPVLYTQMANDETTQPSAWRERRLVRGGRIVCRTGSWGAGFWGVEPAPDEAVVVKHRHTAFFGTDLDLRLRALGRDCLIVTGVNTNVCVEATVRDAAAHGYYVVALSDCTAAYTQAEHESALHNVRTYLGEVMSSAELIAAWRPEPGR